MEDKTQTASVQTEQTEQKELKGVGGWLLFFIVTSCLSMVLEVKEMITVISTGWEGFMNAGMVLFLILTGILDCLYAYGIYSLAGVKKHAVRLIKVLLVGYPLFCVLSPAALLVVVRLTSGMDVLNAEAMGAMYDPKAIGTLIGMSVRSAIWFAYFSVSVRVKNTWPVEQRVKPESVFS